MRTWPALGEADVDVAVTYATDGAVAVGRVLDADQLVALSAAFDGLILDGMAGPYATIAHDGWRRSSVLADLVPVLGAVACAALEVPELVLFHDSLLEKPSDGDDMVWHQDFSYLPLDRSEGTTLWIALDDITEANGCIYYLPGTHLQGERRAAWGLMGDDDPRAALEPLAVDDAEPGIAAPTAAGCAIAHDTLTWHRSPSNTSGKPRRAWALSFVTPDATWLPSHAPHPRAATGDRHPGDPLEPDLPRARRT